MLLEFCQFEVLIEFKIKFSVYSTSLASSIKSVDLYIVSGESIQYFPIEIKSVFQEFPREWVKSLILKGCHLAFLNIKDSTFKLVSENLQHLKDTVKKLLILFSQIWIKNGLFPFLRIWLFWSWQPCDFGKLFDYSSP